MASTPIKAEPLIFGRESTSTDGWTTADHIGGVFRIMGEEIARLTAQRDRLRDYVTWLEDEDYNTPQITTNREYHLQPGDMTDP